MYSAVVVPKPAFSGTESDNFFLAEDGRQQGTPAVEIGQRDGDGARLLGHGFNEGRNGDEVSGSLIFCKGFKGICCFSTSC